MIFSVKGRVGASLFKPYIFANSNVPGFVQAVNYGV